MTIRKHTLQDGTVRYEARYKLNGRETNRRFTKRAAAVDWLNSMKTTKTSANIGKLTVGDAIGWYLQTQYTKRDSKTYELIKLSERIGDMRVSDLNYSVVSRILDKIQLLEKKSGEQISAASARKIYFYFKVAVQTYCNKHNISINSTAFTVKPPPAWSNQKDIRLSNELIEELIGKMKDRQGFYRDFFTGLLQTAGRKQEVLGMRFSEIKDNIWFLPSDRSKTGKSRVIPVFPALAEVIQRRRQLTDSDMVFFDAASSQMIDVFFRKNKPKTATGITFHSFRHEATCRLVEKTQLKIEEIMKITGHDEMKTFFRYYKLRPDFDLAGIHGL